MDNKLIIPLPERPFVNSDDFVYSTTHAEGKVYYVGRHKKYKGLSVLFLQEERDTGLTMDFFDPIMVDDIPKTLKNIQMCYQHPFNPKLLPVYIQVPKGTIHEGYFVGPRYYQHYKTAVRLVANTIIG